jgi:4'-phosphopantetheinyl transferase
VNSALVEIVVVPLDAPLAEANALVLSDAERKRAARLRSESDRRRYIVAHSTLRELLAARSGLPLESLSIEPGKAGKPMLAGSTLEFGLSRSGELAVYAFARGRAVGIDVEAVRPFAAADAVAERTFPRRELRAYAALARHDRPPGFFRGWTRTEALAKALGGGLSLPLESLDAALECGWVVRSFAPAPGFIGAVAYRGRCQ